MKGCLPICRMSRIDGPSGLSAIRVLVEDPSTNIVVQLVG